MNESRLEGHCHCGSITVHVSAPLTFFSDKAPWHSLDPAAVCFGGKSGFEPLPDAPGPGELSRA